MQALLPSCLPENGTYPHPQRPLITRLRMNHYLRYPHTSRLNI